MIYDIKNLNLAPSGKLKIEWAEREMPVLRMIKERFRRERPFQGLKISACLHVTPETANLMKTLKAGGAEVMLCAANPLSTQDEVAASLVKHFSIPVFASRGEDKKTYYQNLKTILAHKPEIILDDGADLVTMWHTRFSASPTRFSGSPSPLTRAKVAQAGKHKRREGILGSLEETTTGVNRLKAMEKERVLQFPVIAVNEAKTKYLFDNRYGTGQSTLDGILRATNTLIAGKTIVISGYGWCGKGVAMRARGLGGRVVITEVEPIRALEAIMEGFEVLSLNEAASLGDIFITVTGNIQVIKKEHFLKMKDGAILCNTGHFNQEIDLEGLENLTQKKRKTREYVEEYTLKNGARVYLLAQGRVVNLIAGEGHPACVMDMSFAGQALSSEYIAKHHLELENKVYPVPEEIDRSIAQLKLETMGIEIDKLREAQKKYLSSWRMGT